MAYTIIDDPTVYFNTKLYTGNASTNAITGVGFQPDWVWIKSRGTAGEDHYLFDSLRGATNYIHSDTTAAQGTNSTTLTAFDSDGFTVGNNNSVNKSSDTLVSWNWIAGTTSGIATNGSTQITPSSYSFNQTSGFSIIRYTGIGGQPKTIPHGLGVQPKMFIIKRLNSTGSWGVLPQQISTGHLYLDATTALGTVNPLSGGVLADTVNFSVSDSNDVNGAGGTYVAYCFADVKGFSKMGSYLGNGNADGTFVYTGFSPAFIMLKQSSASGRNWEIYDSKRIGYNVANYRLPPNTAGAEETNVNIDIISNGFKARSTDADLNASGATYIFMAFAEAPFVSSTGIPTPAR